MRKLPIMMLWTLLLLSLLEAASGQSLDLTGESPSGGGNIVSINFAPEGANVVALQFDLQFNPRKINLAGLRLAKGQAISGDHGFEYRQIQPGRMRVVIYPPIRQQMPPLAAGQTVVLELQAADFIALEEGDIRFVPGSIVLSDALAKAVKLRQATNSVGRAKGRRK
jgi:hypothetical protein